MNSSYKNNLNYSDLISTITFIIKPKKIIEFGILEGFSLKTFAENCSNECIIKAYDIFEEFNGNHAVKNKLQDEFNKFKNVIIDYGNFYEKYKNIDNNIDIIHIDIANNGDIIEFALEKYYDKLSENGIFIFEGGSLERDEIEWMNKYNKPKINPVLEKYKNKYLILTIGDIPSITIVKKVN